MMSMTCFLILTRFSLFSDACDVFPDVASSFAIIVELSGRTRKQHALVHSGMRIISCMLKMIQTLMKMILMRMRMRMITMTPNPTVILFRCKHCISSHFFFFFSFFFFFVFLEKVYQCVQMLLKRSLSLEI